MNPRYVAPSKTVPIKEIDDLDLIECPSCYAVKGASKCHQCHGTGDIVTRKIRFYYLPEKDRKKRAA